MRGAFTLPLWSFSGSFWFSVRQLADCPLEPDFWSLVFSEQFLGILVECDRLWRLHSFFDSYNQSLQSYLGMLKHCNGHKMEVILKNNFTTGLD